MSKALLSEAAPSRAIDEALGSLRVARLARRRGDGDDERWECYHDRVRETVDGALSEARAREAL